MSRQRNTLTFVEGMRWLMLRPVIATVRSWEDGVSFGIGYRVAAIPIMLGAGIHKYVAFGEMTAPLNTLVRMIMFVNDVYSWRSVLFKAWEWGLATGSVPQTVNLMQVNAISQQPFTSIGRQAGDVVQAIESHRSRHEQGRFLYNVTKPTAVP